MSKVVSQHGVVEGGVYRHFKGKEYVVLGFVINSTNVWTAGSVCVRYRRLGGKAEFVRLETEFIGKTGKHWMNEEPRFVFVRHALPEEVDVRGALLNKIAATCQRLVNDEDVTTAGIAVGILAHINAAEEAMRAP